MRFIMLLLALFGGFVFAAVLMCAAAVIVAVWGIDVCTRIVQFTGVKAPWNVNIKYPHICL